MQDGGSSSSSGGGSTDEQRGAASQPSAATRAAGGDSTCGGETTAALLTTPVAPANLARLRISGSLSAGHEPQADGTEEGGELHGTSAANAATSSNSSSSLTPRKLGALTPGPPILTVLGSAESLQQQQQQPPRQQQDDVDEQQQQQQDDDEEQQQQQLDQLPLLPSGASSPTAASEYSVAGSTAASTSTSAVPFSHIAHARKQQEREASLRASAHTLLHDAGAAFNARMAAARLDLSALQQVNDAAAERYGGTAELAAALGQFVGDLGARQAAAREALAALPLLDRQLQLLSTAVAQLDRRSRQLEVRLGVKGGAGGGTGSSTYSYLASSVSHLTSAGVAGAAAGLGCLTGSGGSSSSAGTGAAVAVALK